MIYTGILNGISTQVGNIKKFVGKNLFDKNAIQEGKTLQDGTGVVINSQYFYVSDYIEVLGGREICITNVAATTIVAMYDQYKVYIGQQKGVQTFTLESEAAFIRICNSIAAMPANTQQIEYGSVATAYEPFNLSSLEEVEFKTRDIGATDAIGQIIQSMKVGAEEKPRSRNIFNPAATDLLTGYYLNSAGIPTSLGVSETKGWVSGYMLVTEKTHYITNLTIGSQSQYMAFYDGGKNLISVATCASTIHGFDTPEGCRYIRITINKTDSIDIANCQVELGIVSTPVRSFYDDESVEEQKMLSHEGNLLDVSAQDKWLQGYFDLALVFHNTNNNFKTTDYIRVKGGQYYFFLTPLPSNSQPMIFFDSQKKVIVSGATSAYALENLGFVKIPDNAVYMMLSTNIADERIVFKNTFYNEIGHGKYRWYYGDIQKEGDRFISRAFLSPDSTNLLAYFDGCFILRDATNTKLYIGRDLNTIFANRSEITISELPNIGTGVVTYAHIFQNTHATVSAKAMVYVFVIVTDNSKIYSYTYDSRLAFSPTFTESSVWIGVSGDMPQMRTDAIKGGKYGLKILPNNDPESGARLQYFKFLNTNVDLYSRSGERVFQLGGYTGVSIDSGVNKPYESAPTCLYTTTDGIDFYVTYMFGFSGSRYRMAGGSIVPYSRYRFGEDLDTSLFSSYAGGLKMKVRLNVVPSSDEINPEASFEYLEEVNIVAASNAAKGVFSLSDASGVQVGDCVCITGSAANEWGGLINSAASATSGGNGIFFMITSKDGNDVTLATCVGNPHNPLFCTHCHAVSPAWNGVILSTGEEYPESWLIYVDTYQAGYPSYRINSSEKGVSRSCGVAVRPDNKLIYAADTATGVMEDFIGQVAGRTDKLKVSPLGLWKFDMADVDDHSKYTLVHGNLFSIYALRRLAGNTLYAAAQGGEALLSFDDGDSFEKICQLYSELALNLGSDHNTTFFMGRQSMNPRLALIVTLK